LADVTVDNDQPWQVMPGQPAGGIQQPHGAVGDGEGHGKVTSTHDHTPVGDATTQLPTRLPGAPAVEDTWRQVTRALRRLLITWTEPLVSREGWSAS
jgi:hypothetical protein